MEILIATRNKGKVREYETLLDGLPITLLSLADVGLADMDVEESGSTFAENAQIKALTYARTSDKLTLADDSGLCVNALDGAPGIYSARYAGPGQDDAGRRRYLLQVLDGVPEDQREAYFVCVIALADPRNGTCQLVEGRCDGHITLAAQDDGHGFGYDPLFMPNGYDRTFAQIPKAEKNRISHRGRAAQALVPILRQMVNGT